MRKTLRKLFDKRTNSSHFQLKLSLKSFEKHGFYPARFVDVSFVGKKSSYIIKFLKFSIEIFW